MSEDEPTPVEATVTRIRSTDRRVLFMIAAMFLIFGLLSWRVQINQDRIGQSAHRQALYNWSQCQRSVVNTTKLNATSQVQIDFLTPFLRTSQNRKAIERWIAIYRDAKLIVPDCGPRP